MTILDMADLLTSFFFGSVVSVCFCLWYHHQHKKAWQSEYRRLTRGYWGIYCRLVGCQGVGAIKDEAKSRFKSIVDDMQKLNNGEN